MLSRAVRIARIRGVEVRLDPSLVVLAALLAWLLFRRFEVVHGQGIAVVMAAAGSLLFFASILAHELGHAFEATHRGIGVKGVTLLLFGGVTEMHHESRTPRDEFVIAAVGPYISLVCAAVAHIVGVAATRNLGVAVATPIAELAMLLAYLNLLLAVFNLIPGAPLDGGRVLRAGLWWLWGDRRRAVRGAARAGQAFGIVVVGFGVLEVTAGLEVAAIGGLWWLLIGAFLFRAATSELRRDAAQAALSGHTAGEALVGDHGTPWPTRLRGDGADTPDTHASGIATSDPTASVPDPDRPSPAPDPARPSPAPDRPSLAVDAPFEQLVQAHVAGADEVLLTDRGVVVAVVTERQTAHALRRFERAARDDGRRPRVSRDRTPV